METTISDQLLNSRQLYDCFCIDFERRNKVLITQGAKGVKKGKLKVMCVVTWNYNLL